MNARKTWIGVGILLASAMGAPVIADDTELMLLAPEKPEDSDPSILFILDTSGSMAEFVQTREPYDSTQAYPGADGEINCSSDKLYWTDVDTVPDCSSAQGVYSIEKTAFKCAAAAGRLIGIGSYSDTMVQLRPAGAELAPRWQELEAGDETGIVECQADSGVHGMGTIDELWASNDSDDGFTSDAGHELSWGSAPATVTYTVYDGNYLNWKKTPDLDVVLSKMEILKAVMNAVLNSISDVNVGVMRFNDNEGGPVIKAISSLDADRQNVLDTIEGLTADGATPLSETLYEAARYWRGLPVDFGNLNEFPTDPDALTPAGDYEQPAANVCSRNFNVLISDGAPNDDDKTPGKVANLPGFEGGCDGDAATEGHCLDDVARYLATVNIDAEAEDSERFVTTYTIGFAIDVPVLEEAAADSRGDYFLADDVESLALALLKIADDVTERSLSFSAPAISVNTFNRTQNLNDLYLTVFSSRNKVHWPGNLKKFTLIDGQIADDNDLPAINPENGFFRDSAESIWSDGVDGNDVTAGGAAHRIPLPEVRKLYTNNGANLDLTAEENAISVDNADAFEPGDFGLIGAAGEPTETQMIEWMRGVDIKAENLDPEDTAAPRNAMGDPLHSRPAAVVYGGDEDSPDVVVFTGTNDGYLHAIDGDDGKELWAFVPKELLGDMNLLFFDPNSNFKHYGIDGDIVPVVMDNDRDGVIESGDQDFVYLLFGLRRGGKSYYALDVTDRDSPELLWIADYPEFGQTWSTPVVTRVQIGTEEKRVAIVGGGYDPIHDMAAHPSADQDAQGAGVHMLDLETGQRLWRAGPDGSGANLELDGMTSRAIPTRIRVIDMNADGRADRMYAADLGGQVWRFDISNGNSADELVAGGVIAQLGAEGAAETGVENTRRFYNSPDVAVFRDPLQNRRYISISIGSGYRAHPLNTDVDDMFFSIRDPDVFNQLTQDEYNGYDVVTVEDLETVAFDSSVVIDSEDRGWKFLLPEQQAVLADSLTFNDSIFFVGFSPEAGTDPCEPGPGRNSLYQINVVNGEFPVNNLDSPVDLADTEGETELAQTGIAPAPGVLFPRSSDADCEGAECAQPAILCIGTECFDPGFANNPVRTLWTQDGVE